MRFSLKWLLAVMAYVALAAVALTQRAWYFADALNILTMGAILYAATLAILARGETQGVAIGFVLGAVINLGAYYLAPAQTLTARVTSYLNPEYAAQPPTPPSLTPQGSSRTANGPTRSQSAPKRVIAIGTTPREVLARAANATITMLAGLLGAGIGVHAARHAGAHAR